MSLSIGLGSIARKDASPLRRYLFEKLLEANWTARLAFELFRRPGFRVLVSWALVLQPIVRLLSARVEILPQATQVSVFNYSNERSALAGLSDGRPDNHGAVFYQWSVAGFVEGSAWLAGRFLKPRKARQGIRISLRILRKRGFLVGARQTQFLLLYAYFHDRLESMGIRRKTFNCSTESNPEVIAVVLAARRLGNRTTFVNHGFLDKDLGILFHDQFVLDCEALLNRIEAGLPQAARPSIEWRVSQGEIKPLRYPDFSRIRQVGIVGSLAMSKKNYLRVIRECLTEFPSAQIFVRPHPNSVITGEFYRSLPAESRVHILSTSPGLLEAVESWDFAIAGGTSAHLELLRAGIPTIYMDIDGIERDAHGFVLSGILPEANSVSEIAHRIPGTYSSPDWDVRFSAYNPRSRSRDEMCSAIARQAVNAGDSSPQQSSQAAP